MNHPIQAPPVENNRKSSNCSVKGVSPSSCGGSDCDTDCDMQLTICMLGCDDDVCRGKCETAHDTCYENCGSSAVARHDNGNDITKSIISNSKKREFKRRFPNSNLLFT